MSLVCGELVETHRLAVIPREPATAGRIQYPETVLPACVSLVCGELEVPVRGPVLLRRQIRAAKLKCDPWIIRRGLGSGIAGWNCDLGINLFQYDARHTRRPALIAGGCRRLVADRNKRCGAVLCP
jgi:hypothetical protein